MAHHYINAIVRMGKTVAFSGSCAVTRTPSICISTVGESLANFAPTYSN